MPGQKDNDMTIDLGFNIDKQSEKKVNQSFKNTTALIADLAIIGKVAGEALGKVWDGLQKTMEVGVKTFANATNAQAMGFSPTAGNKLNAALGEDAAKSVMSGINTLMASIQNPELGEDGIKVLYETLGRAGDLISADLGQQIVTAMESGDAEGATKLIAGAIHTAGDRGSELASMLGLGALAGMEVDQAFQNFMKVMNDSSSMWSDNVAVMGDIASSSQTVTGAFHSLSASIAELMAGPLGDFAHSLKIFAEAFKDMLPDIQAWMAEWKKGLVDGMTVLFGSKESDTLVGADVQMKDSLKPFIGFLADWNGLLRSETMAADVASAINANYGMTVPPELIEDRLTKSDLRDAVDAEGIFTPQKLAEAIGGVLTERTERGSGDTVIYIDGQEVKRMSAEETAAETAASIFVGF